MNNMDGENCEVKINTTVQEYMNMEPNKTDDGLLFDTLYFQVINICSVVSCNISAFVSVIVIIFLFLTEYQTTKRSFHRWSTGERLVVYLAVFDLGFSIFHSVDFSYMLFTGRHPPDGLCIFMAFILLQNVFGQWLIVSYTSVSAFLLVLFQKRFNLGKADWKLLVFVVVPPGLFNIFGVIFRYLGPGPQWCGINTSEPAGRIARLFMVVLTLIVFIVSFICYITILLKMKTSGPKNLTQMDHARRHKYNKSAHIMMIFVVAYLLQWWPWVLLVIRSQFGKPEWWIMITKSILVNLGGVFNGFAYTWMRRYYLRCVKRPDRRMSNSSITRFTTSVRTRPSVNGLILNGLPKVRSDVSLLSKGNDHPYLVQ